ncbi:MAG: preprotein translocase subunit YajC [Chloroflexi bacterium]|nr:preprotein translocase subunit YajC [Chloroflexota bacterium]
MIIFVALAFGAFYFLLIRPQRKRQKEHQSFIEELQTGDKVITIGGMFGEIDSVGEQDFMLKVEDGTRVKFLKNSIMGKQQTDLSED